MVDPFAVPRLRCFGSLALAAPLALTFACAGGEAETETTSASATATGGTGSAGTSSGETVTEGSVSATTEGTTGTAGETSATTTGTTGTTGTTETETTVPTDTIETTETTVPTGTQGTTEGTGVGGCSSDDPAPGLWCPSPGVSWQWQIDGEAIDTSIDVDMYDIDLFEVTDAELSTLKADGRVVICYFSAGSYEEWRDDADDFPMAALGDPLDGWPGERWLDVRDPGVRAVQAARLDLAAERGCDGVEPDNVDGYANASGFPLKGADQLDYNLWLATEAHARGLSIGLKNDLDQVGDLLGAFDWALNEECAAYDECALLSPFIDSGKAVFNVEYVDDKAEGANLAAAVCADALGLGFSTLIKEWDLGPWRLPCA